MSDLDLLRILISMPSGALQRKKFQKSEITMEVGGLGPGLTRNLCVCGKSSQNSPKPVLIFWSSTMCILSV